MIELTTNKLTTMSLNIGHSRPWRPYKLCTYKKKKCNVVKIGTPNAVCSNLEPNPVSSLLQKTLRFWPNWSGVWPYSLSRVRTLVPSTTCYILASVRRSPQNSTQRSSPLKTKTPYPKFQIFSNCSSGRRMNSIVKRWPIQRWSTWRRLKFIWLTSESREKT